VPAAALAAGIAAGRLFIFFPFSIIAASSLLLLAVLFLKGFLARRKSAAVIFFAAGFGIFFLYGPGTPSYLKPLIGSGPVKITGEVAKPPREKSGNTLILLKPYVPGSGLLSLPKKNEVIRINMQGTGLGFSYGDVLTGTMTLYAPVGYNNPGTFDWGEYAESSGEAASTHLRPGELTRIGERASTPLKWIYSLRQRLIICAGRSLPPERAAIWNAMVLGDQSAVTDEMRDDFQASGTSHILAVSGSHVALLAALVYFLANWSFFLMPHRLALRVSMKFDPRKLAALTAIPVSILYCILAGSSPATVRSVIMITVFLTGRLIERETNLLNVLSAAALIVLALDPSALFDISFQLSYGAVLIAAVVIRAFGDADIKGLGPLSGRVRRNIYMAVAISVAVVFGIAPIVAMRFNSFSWVSTPSNILLVPIAGYGAVPLGLISCLIYAVHPASALPMASLNSAAIGLFYGLVKFFASAPGSNLHPAAPGPLTAVLFYALLASVMLWRADGKRKGAAAVACVMAFTAISAVPYRNHQEMRVTFLDVGHGDASLVEFPDGKTMLIDGGGNIQGTGADPGRSVVAPFLWNRGIRSLDYIVLSHPHPDHMDGLCYVMKYFKVGEIWEGGLVSSTRNYARFRRIIEEKNIQRRVFTQTCEIAIGGAAVQVLNTASTPIYDAGYPLYRRENNRSLVLRIKYGEKSFLFTGDIQEEAEESMLKAKEPLPLSADVLKVPHHGGPTSNDVTFIRAVNPKVAVISTGHAKSDTPFLPDTVEKLKLTGTQVYITNKVGAVTIYSDGKNLSVLSASELSLREARSWRDELYNMGKLIWPQPKILTRSPTSAAK